MNDTKFGDNIHSDVLPEMRMEPAVVREAPVREVPVAVVKERRVRIVLEDNDAVPPLGQYFGVNGVGYLLKSNMEADVPLAIIDILNNAVTDRPVVDPDTRQVIGWKKQLRFPYRVIRVIEPELAAA